MAAFSAGKLPNLQLLQPMSNEAAVLDPNAPVTTTNPNPTPSQESWANGWVKPDGSLDHSRFDKAPDDFKGLRKDVERYKTFDEYLKGQKERESLLGKKGLVEPLPADATKEQVAERSALLRKINQAPEDAKGYGLAKPEGVDDKLWDQAYADQIAAVAHKHGLPPAALKELAQVELTYVQQQQKAQADADKAFYDGQDKLIRDGLTKDGLDFGKGKELAERAGRKWGVDPASPLMKNATVFMLLTRLAKAQSEDELIKGELETMGINGAMTAEQADKAANDIMRNKENPLYDAFKNRDHVDHDAAVKKWNGYNKIVAAAQRK